MNGKHCFGTEDDARCLERREVIVYAFSALGTSRDHFFHLRLRFLTLITALDWARTPRRKEDVCKM